MYDNIEEFVSTLLAPMPEDAASEYLELCKQAFAGRDSDAEDSASEDAGGPFDQVYLEACKLRRAQRLRLITTLVNHEILLVQLAKDEVTPSEQK